MPSAAVQADGTFSLGYSYDQPYGTLWATATILPFIQVTGRFVSVSGIPGFTNVPGEFGYEYGRYKDKVIDFKARLLAEGRWVPAVALGASDIEGTGLFKGHYLVATKTLGSARNVEVSAGLGRGRLDGAFAGVRWRSTATPAWSVVAEYDANKYANDFNAALTDAGARRKGAVLGLEYRWGWLGAQVARHRDHFSANVYASVPMAAREFIPKIYEPRPHNPKTPPSRLTVASLRNDPASAAPLIAALSRQNFKNIRVAYDSGVLRLSLTNARISEMGRAVGRASRTALAFAPAETRAIYLTYTRLEQPVATYELHDLAALTHYLTGAGKRDEFLKTVVVRYSGPHDSLDVDKATLGAGVDEGTGVGLHVGRDGNLIQVSSEDRESNRLRIAPKVNFFFNDPSGALRYDLAAVGSYDRRLGSGLYLNGAVRLSVLENISGVTQPSNSELPHVRTDVAEYKRGGRFKLNRLMLNQYFNPAERIYARLSAGFYEEMYRGVGGQILYVPNNSRWATDLSVDALQQRGVKGWLDKRDYRTVTAIGALHYKLPYDITVTARAGRFLAKDTGVRIEMKRRFRSGIEVGAWYTKTNGNDITSPGTPLSPYNDKGVFLSIPLRTMLPSDSQAGAGFALSPWTRDVGQMVASPGDLYSLVEQPRRDLHHYDGLGDFAERPDEASLPVISNPVRPLVNPWPNFRARLEGSAAASPSLPTWAYGGALASAAVLTSAALDKPVDRFVRKHEDRRLTNSLGNFGKNMPVALVATSGIAAALGDARMQNTGIIALQSVAGAIGATAIGKYSTGRARPEENLGTWASTDRRRSDSSFPSGHSAVAFAAVTPFAQEYDAPWLYGVAAISAAGRVANRKHFVSDTVAGGLIGYAVGTLLWEGQRNMVNSQLSVVPGPKSIAVAWQGSY
ncbi:YjbH domain-containing protein [Massilia sp. PAMC28688]|nr:YjbH domain-containing protein [Massilia sp. PAMC28688]